VPTGARALSATTAAAARRAGTAARAGVRGTAARGARQRVGDTARRATRRAKDYGRAKVDALRRKLLYARRHPVRAAVKTAKKMAPHLIGTGVYAGVDYALHRSEGGAKLNRTDVKNIALDSGLTMMQKGLRGDLTPAMVTKELREAARRNMAKKPKTGAKSSVEVRTKLRDIHNYLEHRARQRAAQRAGRSRLPPRVPPDREFGTGARGGGARKCPKKKRKVTKKKKKGGRRRKPPAKKKKKKKGGRKPAAKKPKKRKAGYGTMNVAASLGRYRRMRDVFDIV
jgi:hypothetical protein